MLRFTSGFLEPLPSKPLTPISGKGKEKKVTIIETKKRKALDLASGNTSKKVGHTTWATATTSMPVEIDPSVLASLSELLSLPLIYMNESVILASWLQIHERKGLEAMCSTFLANMLVCMSILSINCIAQTF